MGHALALDTGAGTHFTVVYFNKNRIDATILNIAKTYCAEKGLATVAVKVGDMWGANSIYVVGALETLKTDLTNHFHKLGFDVDMGRRGQTAHINIRGNQSVVTKMHANADLVNGWRGI